MEAAGASHLDHVRITPSNDGAVAFEAHLASSPRALTFRATVTRDGTTVATGETAVTDGLATLTVHVANPQLWSPDHPNLYDVAYDLVESGRTIDRVQSYFGFRRITIGHGRLLINDEPTFLKMVLDQGYWRDSNLTPPSDDAIASDIRMAKAMGFNGARKHQKVADPRYLYWADRLGFLVSGEMANAQQFDADYVAEFTREWIDIVARDVNHPSIVMWVPINESWGVPDATTSPAEQAHLQANYWLVKSLDPTRLVIDNDGWQHTGTTDLFGFHDYARTGDAFYRKYKDAGSAGFVMPPNGRPVLLPGFTYNGSPLFLSEFGGIAYIAPGSRVPADAWGYSGVEPDAASALARLRGLYEAIARVPAIMGVCYTQLTDVEQAINGLLTYDRAPKYDVAAIHALNDLLH
jgi:beta-galactosidase/beta-glucuronidase